MSPRSGAAQPFPKHDVTGNHMHNNFSEWYRLVSLEPDGTKLAKRWAGVKTWTTELRKNDDHVLETVRIYQGLPPRASREPFLAVFRRHDPSFPQRNDHELRVLAGAALVNCVQSVGEDGEGLHAAILAGAALEASSLRLTDPRLEEISREVATGLQALAVAQRERRPFDASAITSKADAAEDALVQVSQTPGNNADALKNALVPVLQALIDAVRAADEELGNAAHNLRSGDEETDILWWVEGGCSRDTNRPWARLGDGAAIIAGSELADLTDVTLGPRNAAALLDRVLAAAGAESKEATLASYVNALPDDWYRSYGARSDERALDLTPITLAVSQRSDSDVSSWQAFFDSSTGMKSSMALTPTRVARQAYVEAILLRALAQEE